MLRRNAKRSQVIYDVTLKIPSYFILSCLSNYPGHENSFSRGFSVGFVTRSNNSNEFLQVPSSKQYTDCNDTGLERGAVLKCNKSSFRVLISQLGLSPSIRRQVHYVRVFMRKEQVVFNHRKDECSRPLQGIHHHCLVPSEPLPMFATASSSFEPFPTHTHAHTSTISCK